MNESHSRTARRIAAIQSAISKKPMTANEIAAAIYLCQCSTGRYLAHLRQEPKRVHIASWCVRNNQLTPVHAWGDAEDAPKPSRVTRDQWRALAATRKTAELSGPI